MSKKIEITVPDCILDLFNWYTNYDPRFKGNEAAMATYFLGQGILKAYNATTAGAGEVEKEQFETLAAYCLKTLNSVEDV